MPRRKEKKTDNTCRCCLNSGAVESIFNKIEDLDDKKMTYSDMITACSSFQVLPGDGLPQKICEKCLGELNVAYAFRQRCDRTYNTLMMLAKSKTVVEANIVLKNTKDFIDENKVLLDDNIYLLEVENDVSNEELHLEDVYFKEEKDIKLECEDILDLQLDDNDYNSDHADVKSSPEDSYNEEEGVKDNKYLKKHSDSKDAAQIEDNEKETMVPREKKVRKSRIKSCPVCSVQFTRKTELKKHLKLTHPEYIPEKYFCEICNKSYINSRHKYSHNAAIKRLECDTCGSAFVNKSAFINHLKIHSEVRNYVCKVCGIKFKQYAALHKHNKLHRDKEFHCQYCSKSFSQNYNLTVHLRCHTGETPYSCPVCKETFRTGHLRNIHLDKHPTQDVENMNKEELETFLELKLASSVGKKRLNLMCSYCGRMFKRKVELAEHINKHLGIKAYYCEICKKYCSSGRRHKYVHSQKTEKISCEECNKIFASKSSLKTHMVVHSEARPHKCACGATFKQAATLQRHRLTHEDRLFVCHICSKSFTTKYKMIIHVRTHTKERPFHCDQCPLKFATGNQLNTHKLRHNDEKPLQCELCTKSFKTRNDLRQHLKVHEKIRRYTCKICDKSFYRSDHRNRHELTVHSMEVVKTDGRDK